MGIEVDDGQRLIRGRTQNISKGGCSVLARSPMTVGREHSIRLILPSAAGPAEGTKVDLHAVVVWCTRVETEFLAGLKFMAPGPDATRQLETLVTLAAQAQPANDNQPDQEEAAAPAAAPVVEDPYAFTPEDFGATDGFFVSFSPEEQDQIRLYVHQVVEHFWQNRPDPLAFPHIATRIIDALEDPEAHLGRIAGLIQQEPAIMASLLKAANSPLYRRGAPAPDLASAVTKLGLRTVGQLASGVASRALFDLEARTELSLYSDRWRELFHRSLTCAFAASWLAERCQAAAPDRAFSAGMLHDVGHSLALRSLSALQISGKAPTTLSDSIVDAVLEKTHVELGSEMHVAWTLPGYLTDACRQHHDANVPDTRDKKVLHVVRVVSGLNRVRVQPSLVQQEMPSLVQSLKVLGIDRPSLPVIRGQIQQLSERVEAIVRSK
jgi:HD-like signal output (HDOD) protein